MVYWIPLFLSFQSSIWLYDYLIIPLFHCSIVPLFHCSIVPFFHYSKFPLFHYFIFHFIVSLFLSLFQLHYSTLPSITPIVFHYSTLPLFYSSNLPLFHYSTIHFFFNAWRFFFMFFIMFVIFEVLLVSYNKYWISSFLNATRLPITFHPEQKRLLVPKQFALCITKTEKKA